MTPLESLTKKLHALLPELRELSFGCYVEHKGESGRLGRIYENVRGGRRLEAFSELKKQLLFPDPNDLVPQNDVKILGHPITLEHVLKAAHLSKKGLTASCCGKITHTDANAKHRYHWWIIGLPLDKQSPETIKFLDDLIPNHPTK